MLRKHRGLMVALTAGTLIVTAAVAPASAAGPGAEPTFIKLINRTFDPLSGSAAAAARIDGSQVYLVQFRTALSDELRARLRQSGARIGAYVPDFAYVVRMNESAKAAVAKLPGVRWIGAYLPSDKLDASVGAAALTLGTDQRYLVTLVEPDAADQRAVAERVRRLGGVVLMTSESRQHLEVVLDADQLRAVTRFDEVLAVGLDSAPESDMDNARQASGANAIEIAGGYRGQGVRGEVMDGGVRATHQEFRARPVLLHGANSADIGHGTSTYGEIFAAGVSAKQRGMLPQGQGIFALNSVADRYAETGQLVDPAGNLRAVFQSNSWGNNLTTAYTSISAAMDQNIFDHDILICQSQSNDGTRNSRPQAWAKNILSVGGEFHRNTLSRADDAWNHGASIGPAADGRIKPDLSNYYDAIDTTSSNSDTSYTTSFGGTSGATPITCGNAGLLFEMWADGVFDGGTGKNRDVFASRPHAATTKALLINTADQYPFTGATADLTRVHQGWGTASVGNLYDRAKAGGFRLPVLVNETDLLTSGQSKKYTVAANGAQPLRATMVYSDPAGSPTAAVARVNDLTLKVTAPDGTVYWGDNGLRTGNWSTPGGVANTVDTVENVFVQAPAAGTWTVEVIATQINADGHVETAATDADYALVVS